MKKSPIKIITYNAIIASVYVVLTLLTYEISYLGLQFRIAEMLMLLCFFRKDSILGLTLGCAISNIFSFSPLDVVFGTMATILACLCIMFSKFLFVGVLAPVVFNGFIVGFELWWLLGAPFWPSVLSVALGELAVLSVAYIIFMLLKKRKGFFESIGADQNLEFLF